MTDDELAAVEARCDAATPGKWYWETDYEEEGGFSLLGPNMENVGWARHECDIVFLSAVRTDVPALIAEVRRLRAERSGEIAEFNAGFNAQRAGVAYDAPGVEQPYDVWRCGWAWGAFDGLNAEMRRLNDDLAARESRLHKVRALASARLEHPTSTNEEACLWAILNATEGK